MIQEQSGVTKMTDILLNISFNELCQLEEITEQIIIDVVDHGIAEPIEGEEATDWIFESSSVHWLKKAIRLHRDLDIDWIAVAMVIDLLQENECLQKETKLLKNQLRRFLLNDQ